MGVFYGGKLVAGVLLSSSSRLKNGNGLDMVGEKLSQSMAQCRRATQEHDRHVWNPLSAAGGTA